MGVIVFQCQSPLHFSTFSALSKSKLGRPNFPRKEIADGPLLFASQKDLEQPSVLSIQADGNRRGIFSQRTSALGRVPKENGNEAQQSSGTKSSKNQEEIVSLLRRIQSSISGESASIKDRNSKSSDENASVESVLEVLRQSRGRGKTGRKEGNKTSTLRRGSPRKELKAEFSSPVTRPPSNFVRRSPIPSPSNREELVKLRSLSLPATPDENKIELGEPKDVDLQEVEKMKLPELKELAKYRGIKGYSRLKKAELIEMLSSSYVAKK